MSPTAITLIRAAADGDVGAVRDQLGAGADINARTPAGQTALIRAAFFGHADVVRLLLEAGADVRVRDTLGLTAAEWAARKGHDDLARLLGGASRPPAPGVEAQARPSAPPERAATDTEDMSLGAEAEVHRIAAPEAPGGAEQRSPEPATAQPEAKATSWVRSGE